MRNLLPWHVHREMIEGYGVAYWLDCLPRMHSVVGLIPSTQELEAGGSDEVQGHLWQHHKFDAMRAFLNYQSSCKTHHVLHEQAMEKREAGGS